MTRVAGVVAALALAGCVTTLHPKTAPTVGADSGVAAPDFALTAQDGHPVQLARVTAQTHAALVFYRGHW